VGFNNSGIGDANNDRKVGWNTQFQPTYFISDAFSIYTTLYAERTPQWMIWDSDNLIGTFDEQAQQIDAGVNWNIGSNQELRVKMQALGLDAKLRQAWRAERRHADPDQRSDQRLQPEQPRLPGALSLGVQAAVVPVRGLRPRRRPVQRVFGRSARRACATASRCAIPNSWW
jgi:hypothetical protein